MDKNKIGFTLLELIVVVLIVATLSALAIPRYIKAREYAIVKEAVANLKLIQAAEKMYYLEYNDYWPNPVTDETNINTINTTLNLALNETYWDYHVGAAGVGSYIAWANRQGGIGQGPYWACEYYVYPSTTEPVSTNPANCP